MLLWLLPVVAAVVVAPAVDAKTSYVILIPRSLVLLTDHRIDVKVTAAGPPAVVAVVKIRAKTSKTFKTVVPGTVLPTGSGHLNMRVPFTAKDGITAAVLQVHLQFCGAATVATCATAPQGKEIVKKDVPMLVKSTPVLIFFETTKPIYKPGDEVQFRLLPVFCDTMRPERDADTSLSFDLIYVESPRKNRMAQWLKVSWKEAFQSKTFKLPSNPEFGQWKIVAERGSEKDVLRFKVSEYVLPQFVVSLLPPKVMIADDKLVTFSVCATLSTGKPIRADVLAVLYMPSGKGREIKVRAELNGKQTCVKFVKDTKPLGLLKSTYYYTRNANNKVHLNATVIEKETNAKVDMSATGPEVKFTDFEIKFVSEAVFYPGVANFYTLHAVNFDGTPRSGALLDVRVTDWLSSWWLRGRRSTWGFSEVLKTKEDGTAIVRIGVVPDNRTSISLRVRGGDFDEERSCYIRGQRSVVGPSLYKTIKGFNSPNKIYLRIAPLDSQPPQDPCRTKKLKLELQGSIPLRAHQLTVVVMAKGEIVQKTVFPAEGPETCVDKDSPIDGHYRCVQAAAVNGSFLIKCLKGWTGDYCLTPVCEQKCVRGYCQAPNVCACEYKWWGPNCNRPRSKVGCECGFIVGGDDCVCYRGWTGPICDEPTVVFEQKLAKKPVKMLPCPGGCKETDPKFLFDSNRVEKAFSHKRHLEISWSDNMSPEVYLVVYFEYKGREIVADSITLKNLDWCYTNSVPTSATFLKAEVRPGDAVKLSLKTPEASAACSLTISDIALQNFGSSSNVTRPLLLEYMRRMCNRRDPFNPSDFYILESQRQCQSGASSNQKRMASSWMMADYEDASTRFKKAGLVVISDIDILTQQCKHYHFPHITPLIAGAGGTAEMGIARKGVNDGNAEKSTPKQDEGNVQLRSFFPENWKFMFSEPTPPELVFKAPDSMTTWVARFYCLSSKGIGVADPASFRVIKPFYIQMVLPYSMVRGEVAQVPVKVYNYDLACHEVTVSISLTTGLSVLGRTSHDLCICSFERKTVFFLVKPTSLTNVKMDISGTQRTSSGLCGKKPTLPLKVGDRVMREMKVKPEGIALEITGGDVICGPSGEVRLPSPQLPQRVVPDSLRATFTASGDIFGAALTNLDNLVLLPTGCGEQNMVKVAPSVLVLQYLQAAKKSNPALEKKARGFILIGYRRQLAFRYPDGSFASFVRINGIGSTWLTAFVLIIFSNAQTFVPEVATNDLLLSVAFLKARQNTNGSFRELGRVYNSFLKGGMRSVDEVVLTSFILQALIEASARNQRVKASALTTVERAKRFLLGIPLKKDISTYSLALKTYALMLCCAASPVTKQHLTELKSRIVTDANGKYLKADPKKPAPTFRPWSWSSAADVEVTAYLLRSLFRDQTRPSLLSLRDFARWLCANRNSRGGFYSTQDTVVALAALAELMGATDASGSAMDLNLKVAVSGTSGTTDYALKPENKLLMRQQSIPSNASVVVKATGNGCAMVQRTLLFNVWDVRYFAQRSVLEGSAESTQDPNACHLAKVKVCHRYKQTSQTTSIQTTMLIVKAMVPSGWKVTDETVKTLRQSIKVGGLQLVESDGANGMVLYYEPSPATDVPFKCVEFNIERLIVIDELKPMQFHIFDYYMPEQNFEWNVAIYSPTCEGKLSSEVNAMKTKT